MRWQNVALLSLSCHFCLSLPIALEKRNITDERAALMEALDKFHAALEDTHPFLGKDSPHLGDLTIYGVLRGLQGLAVVDTVNQAYPTIQAWYQRMEQLVEPKKSEDLEK